MDTLSEEIWDVVIAGTSLPQSLLALSLSRSGKKVLHVDRNTYYGGREAGLSLQDAEGWVQGLNESGSTFFSSPTVHKGINEHDSQASAALGPSRSYTLSLSPQIIYSESSFLPTIVSSQIHTQLEFLAVGSWWVLRGGVLHKVPGSREEVVNDDSLSMREKRALVKFLRFVLQPEQRQQSVADPHQPRNLKQALEERFNIPESLHVPILALALASEPANATDFDNALQRISRHMRSMGYFGPGFGAVIAKYGGNAEIAQVACRAQAVGGGVYLLGRGIENIESPQPSSDDKLLCVTLSDGTSLRTHRVAGSIDDLPGTHPVPQTSHVEILHSISIISDPLKSLFPQTSENGPVPAAAIVLVENTMEPGAAPVYLQVHSEDTGECPAGQCVIYASVQNISDTRTKLHDDVCDFLASFSPDSPPTVLWSLSYTSHHPLSYEEPVSLPDQADTSRVSIMPASPYSIALEDEMLVTIRAIWEVVLGSELRETSFLRFEEREQDLDLQE